MHATSAPCFVTSADRDAKAGAKRYSAAFCLLCSELSAGLPVQWSSVAGSTGNSARSTRRKGREIPLTDPIRSPARSKSCSWIRRSRHVDQDEEPAGAVLSSITRTQKAWGLLCVSLSCRRRRRATPSELSLVSSGHPFAAFTVSRLCIATDHS